MPYKDPVIQAKYKRNHYRKYRKKYVDRMLQRRIDRKAWLSDLLKGRACERCSEDDSWCLEFHHLDPETKLGSVSKMNHQMRPKRLIIEEIAKCQLLCANCHRKEHRRIWEEGLTGGQDHEC